MRLRVHHMHTLNPDTSLTALLRKREFTDKHISELEKLLIAGATANLRIGDSSALIRCIDCGYPPEAIQLLLAHGADPNAQDRPRQTSNPDEGQTALARAACSVWRSYADDWVASLVESGADVNLRDSRGRTVIDYLLEQMQYYVRFYHWHEDMDDVAILSRARALRHTVGPIFETMRFLRDKGAEPSLALDEFNAGIVQVQEHWNRCTAWLVEHGYR